jgi:hypothetical protein
MLSAGSMVMGRNRVQKCTVGVTNTKGVVRWPDEVFTRAGLRWIKRNPRGPPALFVFAHHTILSNCNKEFSSKDSAFVFVAAT